MAKTLIAYFSHAGQDYSHGGIRNLPVGNTEVVAKKLHEMFPSDHAGTHQMNKFLNTITSAGGKKSLMYFDIPSPSNSEFSDWREFLYTFDL